MRNTFSILFYANKSKEKNREIPVMCRITVCGSIAQFSCKISVPTELWSPKEGRALGRSNRAKQVNAIIGGIRVRLMYIYQELTMHGRVRDAVQIRDLFFGRGGGEATLLESWDNLKAAISSRVGKDRSASTFKKYIIVEKHVKEYMQEILHRKDIPLSELDEDFLRGFCIYLRDDVGISQSSVWVYQMPIRTIALGAFNAGVIPKNPFLGYHVTHDVKERRFLSESQLKKLINHPFPSCGKYDFVRNLFLFSCYTGLSFIDLKNLNSSEIMEINNSRWIIAHRQKTKVNFQAKLLPAAMDIILKHGTLEEGHKVFDIGSYCTLNLQLKKVGQICGISDNLTFHTARHTFATLALSKGMSMESLQCILGHTDIHTTQLYAKITSSKLEKDYSRFSEGLCDLW